MSIKRNEFIKHLNKHNCYMNRHDAKHDVFLNDLNKKKTTVPRHTILDKMTCQSICKQLDIPKF